MDSLPAVSTEVEGVPYEPPRVESVMTAEDLTREVQYAGRQSLVPDSLA
jgi:hypothetical protein